MYKLRALVFSPYTFPPLLLLVFALFLINLFRADGVQLDRLSVLAATIAAFTAMILAVSNRQSLQISQRLLDEAVKQREIDTTPHVAVWLENSPKESIACDLVVRNIGRGAAYGVKISFVTGEEDYSNPNYHSLHLIHNGVKFMAPGREVRDTLSGLPYIKTYSFVLAVKYFPSREGMMKN